MKGRQNIKIKNVCQEGKGRDFERNGSIAIVGGCMYMDVKGCRMSKASG
jgi:hypothetical protein